ncbi:MAG TPA: VWA domain-containing protein [Candidatus Angelobacter sp.]|nr:VWA domain-containing protein [Candidatus Angelobacter sp.]
MNPGPFSEQNFNFGIRLRAVLVVFALASVTLVVPAFSQSNDADVHVVPRATPHKEPESQPPDSSAGRGSQSKHSKPLISNVDLVLVPVTVADRMNRAVTGLEKQNFELYEDGQRQSIHSFSAEDAPISLGVILDTSNSMRNKIETASRSIVEFFKTANPLDDFFLITFSDRPELLVDFTTSVDNIQDRLFHVMPAGHTSLLDAIYMGVSKIRNSRYQRRALLIVSDGGDNRSRYTPSEIKRLVQEADVELYGIGIFDTVFQTPEERGGKQLLDSVTEATGGRTFAIKDIQDLPEAANRISLELRNQYVLGFRSSNPARDGKWRKLKVKITPDGMPVHVYSKNGYYSPVK